MSAFDAPSIESQRYNSGSQDGEEDGNDNDVPSQRQAHCDPESGSEVGKRYFWVTSTPVLCKDLENEQEYWVFQKRKSLTEHHCGLDAGVSYICTTWSFVGLSQKELDQKWGVYYTLSGLRRKGFLL